MSDDPFDVLRQRFAALADLPEAEWQHFRMFLRERRYEPGCHLVREGRRDTTFFYIESGLVRLYHTRDGVEQTRGFDYEGRLTGSYESLLTGAPCAFSIEALEATRTFRFPGELMATLFDRHPCWDRIVRRQLEQQWIRNQDKERRFRLYDADAHYRLLLERDPPFLDRVPLRHIASYLGITPETLSRIRTRIRAERSGAVATIGHG
jgi:CRP-like cAMP-binding protein